MSDLSSASTGDSIVFFIFHFLLWCFGQFSLSLHRMHEKLWLALLDFAVMCRWHVYEAEAGTTTS